MLALNLKRVLRLRGIENQRSFLLELDFAPATARRFLNGEVWRIELEDLEKVCLALKCTPNDLLEWQPHETQADADAQALAKLRHDNSDLTKLLASLPLERVQEITDALRRTETK